MFKYLLCLSLILFNLKNLYAADVSSSRDFHFVTLNYLYAFKELPRGANDKNYHSVFEVEFGGRSGILQLYGFVDIVNPFNVEQDILGVDAKTFFKIIPRLSLDEIFSKDLSLSVFNEFYLSAMFAYDGGSSWVLSDANIDASTGNIILNCTPGVCTPDEIDALYDAHSTKDVFFGLGTDIDIPWLGLLGTNLFVYYDINLKHFNGMQLSLDWFKPFAFNDSGTSYFSFSGYSDYQFAADETAYQSSHGGVIHFDLGYHYKKFGVSYALRLYNDAYLIPDSDAFKSSGASNYIKLSYSL